MDGNEPIQRVGARQVYSLGALSPLTQPSVGMLRPAPFTEYACTAYNIHSVNAVRPTKNHKTHTHIHVYRPSVFCKEPTNQLTGAVMTSFSNSDKLVCGGATSGRTRERVAPGHISSAVIFEDVLSTVKTMFPISAVRGEVTTA